MYGTGPVYDGMGLINKIYSYGDTIAISFTSDRAMMPDPEAYAAALRATFEAMRDAVKAAVKPTPAPPVEVNDHEPAPRKRDRSRGAK